MGFFRFFEVLQGLEGSGRSVGTKLHQSWYLPVFMVPSYDQKPLSVWKSRCIRMVFLKFEVWVTDFKVAGFRFGFSTSTFPWGQVLRLMGRLVGIEEVSFSGLQRFRVGGLNIFVSNVLRFLNFLKILQRSRRLREQICSNLHKHPSEGIQVVTPKPKQCTTRNPKTLEPERLPGAGNYRLPTWGELVVRAASPWWFW